MGPALPLFSKTDLNLFALRLGNRPHLLWVFLFVFERDGDAFYAQLFILELENKSAKMSIFVENSGEQLLASLVLLLVTGQSFGGMW